MALLNINVNTLRVSLELRHNLRQFLHLVDVFLLLGHREFFDQVSLDLVVFSFDFLLRWTKFLGREIMSNKIQLLDDVSGFEKLENIF